MTVAATTSAPMQRRWGVPRCGYASNVVMLWVAVRMPAVARGLAWVVAIYFFVISPGARRASGMYLERVHGAGRRGFLRRQFETYRHLVEFGILMMDRAVILSRPDHPFTIDCAGLEAFTAATRVAAGAAEPTGIILLTAHFGMAEVAAPCLRRMGFRQPLSIVMYQNSRDGTERFHTAHRRMLAGIPVISTTDPLSAGVKIIRALQKGELVAMRADRTMEGKGVAVTLLGGTVELPAGPFVAAALSGAPVIHIHVCRVGQRHYRCVFSRAKVGDEGRLTRDERIAREAQDFADQLEAMVRQYPLQWSNFYDFWRIQRPGV